jgi:hypothetical protein
MYPLALELYLIIMHHCDEHNVKELAQFTFTLTQLFCCAYGMFLVQKFGLDLNIPEHHSGRQ